MKKDQIKGIVFIIIGLFSFLTLPEILHMLRIYSVPKNYLIIFSIALIVLGIKNLITNNETEIDDDIQENDNHIDIMTSNENLLKINKVINVTLTGGIIGMLGVSPQKSLNKRIKKENAKGWKVVQIIPAASGNILLYIVRLIILALTFFLYTPANGYYIILEKINDDKKSNNTTKKTESKSTEKKKLNGLSKNTKEKPKQPSVKEEKREGHTIRETIDEETRKKIKLLKNDLKPEELIIQIKKNKEIKIITKEQYMRDRDLMISNKYRVLFPNKSDLM